MDDFLWRALLCGLGLALAAGPLGSFVVWRRMAFFGDALAHSALLGVAIGFLLGVDLILGTAALCVTLAVLLLALEHRTPLAYDTLLGIFAHTALSLGLVALAFMERVRLDLMSYLFGDILAVTPADLVWIWAGAIGVLAAVAVLWRRLLSVTVHEELARVEGVDADRLKLAFVVMLALVIAAAMKIVGILLVTSLLIVPAAAARRLARSPEEMAVLASAAGAVAVTAGLVASAELDTPSGPTIVVAAAALFVLSLIVPRREPG